MDPELEHRFDVLLKKTAAKIIAEWNWPMWRRDDEQQRAEGDSPQAG